MLSTSCLREYHNVIDSTKSASPFSLLIKVSLDPMDTMNTFVIHNSSVLFYPLGNNLACNPTGTGHGHDTKEAHSHDCF